LAQQGQKRLITLAAPNGRSYMGDKAIIQYWPVILTFIAGIMGYATLRADVSYIKAEQERRGDYVYRLPVIENKIIRIEKDIDGIAVSLDELKKILLKKFEEINK